ncbi:MAG: LOG family protein [Planctomyces sp.]|nr:LOG family protein [Planctomyces sp.]
MTPANAGPHTTETISLADEPAVRRLLSQTVLQLWSAVNTLTRLRPSRRERYRVTIFGSARVDPSHWVYAAVRDVSAELTRMGCDIVTGGGPGLMQAANEGARLADPDGQRESLGIRIELPFEQDVNAFVSEAHEHGTFFTRLHHFVLVSDAFVVVPGGIGTVLETMMVWQLLQVRKLHATPLILVGPMWDGLVDWTRAAMLRPEFPLASPEDIAIPICVKDGPAILDVIRPHHAAWKQTQSPT